MLNQSTDAKTYNRINMKILHSHHIEQSLKECNPTHIAVAYIGKDWQKYLPNCENITSIIISPTLGTNPYAIQELSTLIGWDKIHFLDNLHAKIYIGSSTALLGSANLTNNGLSGEGLLELCVEIKDKILLEQLHFNFDLFEKNAIKRYPQEQLKKNKLEELFVLHSKAISSGVLPPEGDGPADFSKFELLTNDQIYVAWYGDEKDFKYSEEYKTLSSVIEDEMHFSEDDTIREGKWILAWKIKGDWTPDLRATPKWIYIHEVLPESVREGEGLAEYSKCAIERVDKKKTNPPFEITNKVSSAFKKAISDESIRNFFCQKDTIYSTERTFDGLRLLIGRMKEFIEQ